MMNKHDIVLQVKELLTRHLDAVEIAHRLHMDLITVQQIINNLLT